MTNNIFGLGFFRFFLAFLVAASHLWGSMPHGFAAYAVWAFFVLSGFLMTYVISEKYKFQSDGLKNYAYNRFLRIYPLYFIAVILGIVTLYFYNIKGLKLTEINGEFYMPNSITEWTHVFTLLPIFQRGGLPVPVSNALSIEVGYYFLLPLLATSRGAALFGFIFGLILNFKLGIIGSNFPERYSNFIPCLLPFALGALICHFRKNLSKFALPKTSFIFWLANGCLWFYFPSWPWHWGLYVSILISAWVVISLYENPVGKIDKFLGDMSYPLYLFHTTVAAWFVGYFGFFRDLKFFSTSFIFTIILCILIVIYIDRPLSRLKIRDTVSKNRSKLGQATQDPSSVSPQPSSSEALLHKSAHASQ